MTDRNIFLGAGALIVVLLIFAIFSSGGRGPDIDDAIAEKLAPVSETVAALDGRTADIEGAVAELRETLSGAVSGDVVEGIEAKLADLTDQTGTLGQDLEAVKSSIADAVSAADLSAVAERVEEVAGQNATLSEVLATMNPVPAAEEEAAPGAEESATSDAVEEETTEVAAADAAASDSDAPVIGVGETAIFGEDTLRVFVSRPVPGDGEVTVLTVQNQEPTTRVLRAGHAVTMPAGEALCRVSVGEVTGTGAELSAICGDDLPAPEGTTAGNTILFEDGSLRVFVSRVLEDEARLFVNRAEEVSLGLGDSAAVTVGDAQCEVTLDTVDRGHVTVSAGCS